MHDPTMHAKALARHVRKSDFSQNDLLNGEETLKAAIERAVEFGLSGFPELNFRRNMLKGKAVYQLTDFAASLVVRHITSHIRRVTGAKQDNREFIVTCMQRMLSEGTPFRVYKYDIRSFYESVLPGEVFSRLESDIAVSAQSVRALRSLFTQLEASGICGLPRGMPLSATLAEYLLRDFDEVIANVAAVWFYARFVDDILVISSGREDVLQFAKEARDALPPGLQFNSKSRSLRFIEFRRDSGDGEEHCFDFLGYRFSVGFAHRGGVDRKIVRDTWLDIAPSKVRKLKTRIALSLLSYSKDDNFGILLDRFRLLTSNFKFVELDGEPATSRSPGLPTEQHTKRVRRTSGIYFNYPLIAPERSTALPELDEYVLRAVTAPHSKNRLRPDVTALQRQQLLNLRFQDGFMNKRFFSFSTSRLAKLKKCWAYA